MAILKIRCPAKGTYISTGIEVRSEDLHKLPSVRTFTYCPRCGKSHSWTIKEALGSDALQKFAEQSNPVEIDA